MPFVDRVIKTPEKISASTNSLDKYIRNTKQIKLLSEPSISGNKILTLEPNTILKVEAATAGWYKVSLPDEKEGFVNANNVTATSLPVKKVSLKHPQPLLDEPDNFATAKTTLTAGQPITILGLYNDFYFVTSSDAEGWVSKRSL